MMANPEQQLSVDDHMHGTYNFCLKVNFAFLLKVLVVGFLAIVPTIFEIPRLVANMAEHSNACNWCVGKSDQIAVGEFSPF